ncbi:MAG: DoxX family protein [Acidobacteria bacterium]|nr:DoxX family protein [Acidobacteriota bacterium]
MTRIRKIIYWIATVWLALGLFATGIAQLLGADGQGGADMLAKLGYPAYIMPLLGVWKILAVVALLVPKFPLIKEWAYAGVFFLMSGAIYSHIAAHDAAVETLPGMLLLVLGVISWYLRPESRRVMTVGK